jgi:hypothetical protein
LGEFDKRACGVRQPVFSKFERYGIPFGNSV